MIFDAKEFEEIYADYLKYNDPIDLEDLCEGVADLIQAIALSVSDEHADDLMQEGQCKFIQMVKSGIIDPARGSVYSFLSFALKNHMIDYLRSLDVTYSLEDYEADRTPVYIDDESLKKALLVYAYERFPSIEENTIDNIAVYIYEAIKEEVRGRTRGIIKTIVSMYGISRSHAYTIYHSCMIFLRCEVLGLGNYDTMNDVLYKDESKEFTLLPDVAYLTGHNYHSPIFVILQGTYVKF